MASDKKKEVPDDIQKLLCQVVEHFDKEDRYVRERQIRTWKKLKYYWAGFQRIWWNEVAHDWRVYGVNLDDDVTQAGDASFYDKPINIFRAYLESIIAALSVTIPDIKCYPDDADNALDLATAKAGDKISQLIARHNNVSLLWLHALFIYCTEGMVAAYNYPKEDYKFGSYSEPEYKDEEEEVNQEICPICKMELVDESKINQEIDEFQPGDDDAKIHNLLYNEDKKMCPNCMALIDPEIATKKIIVTKMVGISTKPKSRQCIEVYGGLYVKVPNWARKQEDCTYLYFSYETHYANAIERYPDLRDKFTGDSKIGPGSGGAGSGEPYERWARLSTQYFGEYPTDTCTIKNAWLRPEAFNVLPEDDAKKLKKEYPDGVKVVKVNDIFADAENECLDDCWTLTCNPLSDYVHFDPLGMLLTSIQEITNDLVSLVIQTIEHGIPQTFADPGVLNFNQYKQTEVSPGAIYPATPKSGKSVGDAFHEVKTATLSGEVLPFSEKMQEAGQLVSGALPSLFGGDQPNSSKTAAQYSMSRAQALQRLQTTWKMFNVWWKEIFGKVIPQYIESVVDDERIVEKDEAGNFINVFIRKAELQGKIGSVELESSDQLPITWSQKKDVYMNLMQMNNPLIMQALSSPENLEELKEAIGLDDFVIPGEDDRNKQYEEIYQLVNSTPIPSQDPMTGQMTLVPSVDIDPMVDNNEIEADICRRWLVGDAGRLAKIENPDGYKNVLLHMKRHVDMIQMQQAPPQQPQPQQGMQGEGNVSQAPESNTIQ
jgi:hypothetical protein